MINLSEHWKQCWRKIYCSLRRSLLSNFFWYKPSHAKTKHPDFLASSNAFFVFCFPFLIYLQWNVTKLKNEVQSSTLRFSQRALLFACVQPDINLPRLMTLWLKCKESVRRSWSHLCQNNWVLLNSTSTVASLQWQNKCIYEAWNDTQTVTKNIFQITFAVKIRYK